MRRVVVIGIAALAALGCTPTNGTVSPVRPETDAMVESYQRELHDVLAPSCATLDCHGDEGRPLRLYSKTGLRIRDELRTDDIGSQDMTPEEHRANVRSLLGLEPEQPNVDALLVLLKPLAVSQGGIFHEGREIWDRRDNAAWICTRAWLVDGAASADARAACLEARGHVVYVPACTP